MNDRTSPEASTAGAAYTQRLRTLEAVWWKRLLNVQAPYAWNLRRLEPRFMLDVGCGLGRNLLHAGVRGVGVDHNPHSVEHCRAAGLEAYTPAELRRSQFWRPAAFDSLLFGHVLEHMASAEAAALVQEHLPLLKPGGQVLIITPQECGYRSDPTHVTFVDFAALRCLGAGLGLRLERQYSFPFPRLAGRFFRYNEFVVTFRSPGGTA